MKTKLIYAACLLLAFGAASGTGRTTKTKIEMVYTELPNGDYRLYLFGSDRVLVCEEKPITIVQQGDAVSPVVLECKH
jgi:hypothetical protein